MMQAHAVKIFSAALLDALVRCLVVEHTANNGLQKTHTVRMRGQKRDFVLREHPRTHAV